ncbi:hypothetical protein GIB67_024531 [Kingdonia uniflora]|uniref:Glucose-methanol-choline oxidoreductase N-terminal domain-containing protein n=1 Tax=Kingdonia uniflora TaxID=39325 RepID=A0A7J7LP78_9MAGN|nr:hypothetical protein GIB67_024531 [Kingdonia uniflora]
MSHVKYPHDDPLVIMLKVRQDYLHTLLVDKGSVVDVLFKRAIEVIGLKDFVKASTTTVISFNGSKESATDKITLPVQEGSETTFVKFIVIDVESKYLGILGRSWLHSIRAVPSTYHLALRFPTDYGVYKIKGSQAAATGDKRGTDITWLVDAVDNGAMILTGCKAERFILEKNHSVRIRKKKCVGLIASICSNKNITKRLEIKAKVMISASGSLLTPPLMLSSGLRNPNIEKKLHLHPVLMVWGYFPETLIDLPRKTFQGGIITSLHKISSHESESDVQIIIDAPTLRPHPDLTVTSEERILDAILLWGAHTNRLCGWQAVDAYVMSSTPDLLFGDRFLLLNTLLPLACFLLMPLDLLKKLKKNILGIRIPVIGQLVMEAIEYLDTGMQ